eukprot:1158471-Pelagomonas_calceolata.AAC.1
MSRRTLHLSKPVQAAKSSEVQHLQERLSVLISTSAPTTASGAASRAEKSYGPPGASLCPWAHVCFCASDVFCEPGRDQQAEQSNRLAEGQNPHAPFSLQLSCPCRQIEKGTPDAQVTPDVQAHLNLKLHLMRKSHPMCQAFIMGKYAANQVFCFLPIL